MDDAIIAVENMTRFMIEYGQQARQAAREALGEEVGPIITASLVLMAIFVPAAFMPGVTGQLYEQFALTIACRERKRQTNEVKSTSDELVNVPGAMSTATHNLGSRPHAHDTVR